MEGIIDTNFSTILACVIKDWELESFIPCIVLSLTSII